MPDQTPSWNPLTWNWNPFNQDMSQVPSTGFDPLGDLAKVGGYLTTPITPNLQGNQPPAGSGAWPYIAWALGNPALAGNRVGPPAPLIPAVTTPGQERPDPTKGRPLIDKGATDPTAPTTVTIPGTGGPGTPPPTIPQITPADYSAYRAAIAKAAPTAPTETQEDKLMGVLSGLAAGMQNVTGGGKGIGNLLMNLGIGSLAGLAGEKQTYKKAQTAYQEALQSYNEKLASGEFDIAGQREKESVAQATINEENAKQQWEYNRQQQALRQPKVLSTKGGVTTYSTTEPDGSIQIHTMGSQTPTDIGYYSTQAGDFPQNDPMGGVYAGIDVYARRGMLHGPGKNTLLSDQDYNTIAKQAQSEVNAESVANPNMLAKDKAQRFNLSVYRQVYELLEKQGKTQQALDLGRTLGTQKSRKEAPQQPVDTSETDALTQ